MEVRVLVTTSISSNPILKKIECKYMKHVFELRRKDQIEERSLQLVPNLSSWEREKKGNDSTDRLQKIFKDKPFIAYRRSPNLRDLLVRAKLKNTNTTPKLTSGTFRCNSTHGCLTCPYIDNARTSYTFSNPGETRQIKQHITCNSTNLTYMIECKKCTKQYIGETKRTIRERFTEHRLATNNPHHANSTAAVPTHFNLPGHSSADMRLIPLELQPTINASRRKARETFLIQYRGKTLSPEGINRKNER